jgi:hypothetical protein
MKRAQATISGMRSEREAGAGIGDTLVNLLAALYAPPGLGLSRREPVSFLPPSGCLAADKLAQSWRGTDADALACASKVKKRLPKNQPGCV